jgi:hypothetical protein
MGINLVGKEQCSYSGDAVLTTTYADDFTTRGASFLFEKNITIASGGTALVLFDYTTYEPTKEQIGQVFIFPPTFGTTAGPVKVNLYRDTNYTGGTEFNAVNPNTLVAKSTSGTTLTIGPTGTTKGTLAMEYLVGEQSHGNVSGGGSTAGLSFFVRDNTKKSLVEIVNLAGAEITFHYGQIFYEI